MVRLRDGRLHLRSGWTAHRPEGRTRVWSKWSLSQSRCTLGKCR